MTAPRPDVDGEERETTHHLKLSAVSLGLALAGAVLPPLSLASGALNLYSCVPIFRDAYTALADERRLRWTVLESFALVGMLISGYFTAFALGSLIYFGGVKIMLRTEDRSRRSLHSIFGQHPGKVWLLVDGVEVEVPFEKVSAGSTAVIRAGQVVPIDGEVTEGTAVIDQHALTGEARPVELGPGEQVLAATLVLSGRILVRVEKAGHDTVAAQIHSILANTADYRMAVQARWEKVADRSVLPTFGLAGVALPLLGTAPMVAVMASNFAPILQIAAPLGMLNYLKRASQHGLLVKDARALEALHSVDTIVFDKTGTLTLPQPRVAGVYACNSATPDDVLLHAAAVEARQTHPVALAILEAASERNLQLPPLDATCYQVGFGIEGRVGGRLVRVGSERYIASLGVAVPADLAEHLKRDEGDSFVYVMYGGQIAGAIQLQTAVRPGAKEAIRTLRGRELTVYIMSGDQAGATGALAAELGVDHYFAEVLPQDKSRFVEQLQKTGRRVCFVGDGINDAIALRTADVSVSLRGGSALAANTAQIILMDESLAHLADLFELAGKLDTTTKATLASTFVPGLFCIGGIFFLHFGVYVAIMLYNLSMAAGITVGVLPGLVPAGDKDSSQ